MGSTSDNSTFEKSVVSASDDPRFLPFAVAGIVCFSIAVALGTSAWLLVGKRSAYRQSKLQTPVVAANPTPEQKPLVIEPVASATPENVVAQPEPAPAAPSLPEGVIAIAGGEIALGGGETKLPLQRELVKGFAISETEVTNAQYSEFVSATGRKSPAGWKDAEFPKGTGEFAVTNVSFTDALAYCKWLSEKTGLLVRLPTEAEWEYAARGTDGRKYPWGNDWNKDAAASEETGSKRGAVKSRPLNRSPFGVYDLAGGVWEWTAEKVDDASEISDPRAAKALESGVRLRVVKGGSSFEPSKMIGAQARYEIPEKTKDAWVGFRFVIEQKNP